MAMMILLKTSSYNLPLEFITILIRESISHLYEREYLTMESCNFFVNSYLISSSAFGKNIKHSLVIFFKLFLFMIK